MSFNFKALGVFQYQATRRLFKHLNRRSQRRSFSWEQFRKFVKAYPLPKLKLYQALF